MSHFQGGRLRETPTGWQSEMLIVHIDSYCSQRTNLSVKNVFFYPMSPFAYNVLTWISPVLPFFSALRLVPQRSQKMGILVRTQSPGDSMSPWKSFYTSGSKSPHLWGAYARSGLETGFILSTSSAWTLLRRTLKPQLRFSFYLKSVKIG